MIIKQIRLYISEWFLKLAFTFCPKDTMEKKALANALSYYTTAIAEINKLKKEHKSENNTKKPF